MAAILSPLGFYGGNRKTKLPLRPKTKIHTPEGHFQNLHRCTIGRMPDDCTLRIPDASLAIPMFVLCFEVFGKCHRTPVRLVRLTWCCCIRSSALTLWINQGTQWFSGEPLETSRTWCGLRQSPLMTWPPWSLRLTLVLRLNQETVHDFVLLLLLPCGLHVLVAPHWIPQTKPTCLLHTWRPHQHQPFALVLHLHQHQSSRNLDLQYLAKSQST
jgi:hypothetical protein